MRRRDLIALFGGGLVAGFSGDWPVASRAQQSSMAKVGLLWPGPAPPVSPRLESFRDGLQRSGYIEGQNIAFELRYGAAVPQQLADQAAELVRAKVDVIATFGDSATKIAQDATGTIPIVALGDDLLGSGLIGSLSRPAAIPPESASCCGTQRQATGTAADHCARTVACCWAMGSINRTFSSRYVGERRARHEAETANF